MNVAFAGSTGHFCNKTDFPGSEGLQGMTVVNIKTQKNLFFFSMSATVWSCRFQAHKNDVYLSRKELMIVQIRACVIQRRVPLFQNVRKAAEIPHVPFLL